MTCPWTSFHAQLHQVLRSRSLMLKCQRILVAVSGGQDSLALIQLLLDLQPHWNWELAIAHCNHRWRADADANAQYVETLAQRWHLPMHLMTIGEAERETIATEAGARAWRYRVLTELAIVHHYSIVVTGHTATDRAETLLYNLMRGSGADGLQALVWARSLHPNVQLIRPLLFMTRTETGQFCQAVGLHPWIDPTNDDWRYARNRIRQDLLPYLQEHFNPKVEQSLAQTAEILQADVAYLEAEAEKLWQRAAHPEIEVHSEIETGVVGFHASTQPTIETGAVGFHASTQPTDQSPKSKIQNPKFRTRLNRKILAIAPLALQRRVMRRWLLQILPKAPTFDHVEKLTALIIAPNRSQTDPFPGGAIAKATGDWITFDNPVSPNAP